MAPAKTPKERISQLIDWFTAAVQTPAIGASLERFGLIPVRNCGSDFAWFLRSRYEEYGRLIREANIQVQ